MSEQLSRVIILDDYQGVATTMADWSSLERRAEIHSLRTHADDEDSLVDLIQDFDVVVAMRERTPFPRSTLQRLPRLRLLVTTGMRNAAVDMDACRDLGIIVCGTGGSSASTAELTWGLILASVRHIRVESGNVRAGGWMTTVGTDLRGRTLGLLGLGHIGAQVATVGRAFGMELIAWSQNLTPQRCAEFGAELVEKDDLFRRSDVLTIHLVLSDRTRGLVGDRELQLMKRTALLVNTSRGPICDELALALACSEQRIAGAALDAFGTEPLPADHPFRTLDNVLATPHLGYVTESTYRRWFSEVVQNISGFMDGRPVRVIQ